MFIATVDRMFAIYDAIELRYREPILAGELDPRDPVLVSRYDAIVPFEIAIEYRLDAVADAELVGEGGGHRPKSIKAT